MDIIKRGLRVLLLAHTAAIVGGCALSIEPKQCCSVEWYLSNDASRAEKLSRCGRISAETIGQSCDNAITAEKTLLNKLTNKN